MHEFNSHIKVNYPNSFIVSEVFDYYYTVLSDYYIGSDSVFNFYMASNVWDKIGNGNSRYMFSSNLEKAYDAYRFIRPDFVDSPFIGNHDLDRIASTQGFNGTGSLEKLKLASSVLLTLPGSPFIYYGDEIGMKGVRYEGTNIPGYGVVYDEYRRQPLLWGNEDIETSWLPSDGSNANTPSILVQQGDENSLYSHYQTMIGLRNNNPALMFGNYFQEFKDNNSNIQGYVRYYQHEDFEQAVLVIHNFSVNPLTLDVDYLELLYNDLTLGSYETVIMTIDPALIGDYI
jgi:glycosidase